MIDKVVSQVLTEKALRDSYSDSSKNWGSAAEKPETVKKLIENGASRIAAEPGVAKKLSDIKVARMMDNTILKPDATEDKLVQLCKEADEYNFASVCVNPSNVKLCAELLKDSKVNVCTVIGFPLGATTTEVKRFETEQAIQNGAKELDMVINIGKLKQGDYDYVFNDINQVALMCKRHKAICKVIIETSMLTDEEKVRACYISKQAKADFVKTSTGFGGGGATAGDIALMRYVVGSALGVKASGGVRSRETAETMIESGADRLGATVGVKIIQGGSAGAGY
jgi:deoxyribose-phosphate aldolase